MTNIPARSAAQLQRAIPARMRRRLIAGQLLAETGLPALRWTIRHPGEPVPDPLLRCRGFPRAMRPRAARRYLGRQREVLGAQPQPGFVGSPPLEYRPLVGISPIQASSIAHTSTSAAGWAAALP